MQVLQLVDSDDIACPLSVNVAVNAPLFEGLKAYRNPDDGINLFRPEKNWQRFNRSAARLDLPQIDRDLFMGGIESLLRLDHEWIPRKDGASLYIRPTMIAVEPAGIVRTTSFPSPPT